MAVAFLREQGMPLTSEVGYDVSKLPSSPQPGVSDVCHSCVVNWAPEGSSMDVAKDREKLAHCHACLYHTKGWDKEASDITQMVEHGLVSLFLGKFIVSPTVRKVKRDMAVSSAGSSSTNGGCKPTGGAKPSNTTSQPASKTGSRGRQGAAASKADEQAKAEICNTCSKKLLALNMDMKDLQGPQQPKGWRQDCITCLELKLTRKSNYFTVTQDNYDEFFEPARMQGLCAQHMTFQLFQQKGMPWGSPVTVDTSKLLVGPNPSISKVCYSCWKHWVQGQDMAVANNRNLVAHCHLCLKEYVDEDQWENPDNARKNKELLWCAIASRFVGKYVPAPDVGPVMTQRSYRAARRAGRDSQQHGTLLDPLSYAYGKHNTWLFGWVDAAWFQVWGGPLVLLSLVLAFLVDLWLSGRDSYLFGLAKRLGLAHSTAAAAAEPASKHRSKKAAAGGSSSTSNRQQLKQNAAGKQGKKKQPSKASSRGRDNLHSTGCSSSGSSTRNQASSREVSSEAATDTGRDQDASHLHNQQDSSASSEASRVAPTQQQQQPALQPSSSPALHDSNIAASCEQQQQALQKGSSSSSANSSATQVQLDAMLAAQLQEQEAAAARNTGAAAAASAGTGGQQCRLSFPSALQALRTACLNVPV
jgi:hypothetical protein